MSPQIKTISCSILRKKGTWRGLCYHLPPESCPPKNGEPQSGTTLYYLPTSINRRPWAAGFKLDSRPSWIYQSRNSGKHSIILQRCFTFRFSAIPRVTQAPNDWVGKQYVHFQSMPSLTYNTPWSEFRQMSDYSFENNSDWTPFLYFYTFSGTLCLKSDFSHLFQGRPLYSQLKNHF